MNPYQKETTFTYIKNSWSTLAYHPGQAPKNFRDSGKTSILVSTARPSVIADKAVGFYIQKKEDYLGFIAAAQEILSMREHCYVQYHGLQTGTLRCHEYGLPL